MTAVCEIFDLLHFRSTAQGGGGHGPSGPMVNTPVSQSSAQYVTRRSRSLGQILKSQYRRRGLIVRIFGTEFHHVSGDTLQMLEVKGQMSRSRNQRSKSQRKVMYQQQKRYNTAMNKCCEFKLGIAPLLK